MEGWFVVAGIGVVAASMFKGLTTMFFTLMAYRWCVMAMVGVIIVEGWYLEAGVGVIVVEGRFVVTLLGVIVVEGWCEVAVVGVIVVEGWYVVEVVRVVCSGRGVYSGSGWSDSSGGVICSDRFLNDM
jgi:hypothetical protein